MHLPFPRYHFPARIVALGLLAFALLTVRFTPNWGRFSRGVQEAETSIAGAPHRDAVAQAKTSGYATRRGYYVTQQVHRPGVEIDDPNHKIVRWRLLVPQLARGLHLPDWATLGLAHLGCLILIVVLARIGLAGAERSRGSPWNAVGLALVAGASAPFFTSMGWLGYYDSWVALALLAVAYARPRGVVWVVCLLAPWISERFVVGFPLAMLVRRLRDESAPSSDWDWFRAQALVPLLMVVAYGTVRLQLGGTGGSQTVGEYLRQFVLGHKIPLEQRLYGGWAGLRVGWILVAVALLGGGASLTRHRRIGAMLLTVGVVLTAALGLYSALDLSRSMVLLLPVVALGWNLATRAWWWRRYALAPVLAALAVILPARQVVGRDALRVDSFWETPSALLSTQNNLAARYEKGDGVAKNRAVAIKWYRKAAEQGLARAQNNLGVMLMEGATNPQHQTEAVGWYRKAAEQGLADAQSNLGSALERGTGVRADRVEAVRWYRRAAEQGLAAAQNNLGVLLVSGVAGRQDRVEAVGWIRRAAEQGFAEAQKNLGVLYETGNGVPRDIAEATKWYHRAADQGLLSAQNHLRAIYAQSGGGAGEKGRANSWSSVSKSRGRKEMLPRATVAVGELAPTPPNPGRKRTVEPAKAPAGK